MGLLDNYSGVGMSPRPKWLHQDVIRRAMRRSYDELEEQGLAMYSESTVTDDWDDLAPDLVIFDGLHTPLAIIEITTHRECRKILGKCQELIARFPEAEYFVYDYEERVLWGYDGSFGEWVTDDEYQIVSRYLSQPLRAYLA